MAAPPFLKAQVPAQQVHKPDYALEGTNLRPTRSSPAPYLGGESQSRAGMSEQFGQRHT